MLRPRLKQPKMRAEQRVAVCMIADGVIARGSQHRQHQHPIAQPQEQLWPGRAAMPCIVLTLASNRLLCWHE